MSLALCGFSIPVLCCLLLVGIGADADIGRRAALFVASGAMPLATVLRGVHALLYAVLFLLAWTAMLDSSRSSESHLFLSVDLGLCALMLLVTARGRFV